MTIEHKKARPMPKGGRTGGAIFPRTAFQESLTYAQKLVSKTHAAPQAQDIIFSAVVGSKTGVGRMRVSSLKQYGFLKGDVKSKFYASDLAKQIVAAPAEERTLLYRQAMLQPAIFRKLFETFHSDTYTKNKIKQRAAELNVHPGQTEACVKLYIAGMQTARLVSVDGDRVTHVPLSEVVGSPSGALTDATSLISGPSQTASIDEERLPAESGEGTAADTTDGGTEGKPNGKNLGHILTPRAIFNVNVTLDSSLDIEKLRQHLELLKQFGAI